jgi:hypothetical protein|tara:strand:+ start:41 stop:469 length:429 start_codon:yes stop_codon:yes gene_type:complete
MNQANIEIVRTQIDDRLVFVHVKNLPIEEKPLLAKKIKVGKYQDKPRIVLQNKILFKCGFDFGVGIRFDKFTYSKKRVLRNKANRYVIRTTHRDSNNVVSKVKNHGVDLPTIDMKRGLEDVFTSGSKVLVEYFQDKIIIEEV